MEVPGETWQERCPRCYGIGRVHLSASTLHPMRGECPRCRGWGWITWREISVDEIKRHDASKPPGDD